MRIAPPFTEHEWDTISRRCTYAAACVTVWAGTGHQSHHEYGEHWRQAYCATYLNGGTASCPVPVERLFLTFAGGMTLGTVPFDVAEWLCDPCGTAAWEAMRNQANGLGVTPAERRERAKRLKDIRALRAERYAVAKVRL